MTLPPLSFDELSDGEKCYLICAVVLASNKAYGPLFCFWDEADSHLALSEVGDFIKSLRRSFQSSSQLLVTSQHPESIRKFTNDSTFLLHRRSHLEPTQVRLLSDLQIRGDLVDSLTRDGLEV